MTTKTLAALAAAALLAVGASACATVEEPDSHSTQSKTSQQAPAKRTHKQSSKPEMTSGQKNALESAQSYIDMSGFSKKGLIQQLSSSAGEGFSRSEATFAANHVNVNWKDEAVESARGYLDTTSFSRAGLMQQLTSSAGEGFTQAQAQYAVGKAY